jgi:outer membrane receptor protein involved in Fe transport
VKNEIDFDYKNLKYVNHQETRHAGLEVMISLLYKNSWKGFININSVKATVGTGMFKGKYLPNAPGLSQSIGVVYSPDHGVGGSLVHHGASGIYIDIENSSKLDAYGVLSTRINYRYKWLTLNFDVNNILNNSYSTNGYLLNETRFFYPAAGRSLYFGLQITI